MSAAAPRRPIPTTLPVLALWLLFYGSFTLFTPALLDDADSVHAEVAREMLLRHDYVTLYANGIRYLEKAPLLYWSMAASMRVAQAVGHGGPRALAAAARVPLALTVLALALTVEIFARRAFRSTRAGLYAALVLMSSPGIFLFTRLTLPDAMLCLWLTLAMLCWRAIESNAAPPIDTVDARWNDGWEPDAPRSLCYAFAACCALGVLTKGLIGVVFPLAIAAVYLLVTRGPRRAFERIYELHPWSSFMVFLFLAAPWHMLAASHNPSYGNPGEVTFRLHPPPGTPHIAVPLPTPGNVHGWAWFYFINEQALRYLNARVPRDYDTVPLWLFWILVLVWLAPWSAFLFKAIANALPLRIPAWRQRFRTFRLTQSERDRLLLVLWAAMPLLFFSFSTRQEYYVLPALPALSILLARWLWLTLLTFQEIGIKVPQNAPCRVELRVWTREEHRKRDPAIHGEDRGEAVKATQRCTAVILASGAVFALAAVAFLIRAHAPSGNGDLASLLQQNPSDYAMSMGHFLDLNAEALALFRLPLILAALSLLGGPLTSYLLWRRANSHRAILALGTGAFGFLLAVHLALRTFAPVLSSAQLADALRPQLRPEDLIVIHQEYEYGSTLGFYLQRPGYFHSGSLTIPLNPIHILTEPWYDGKANYGRSANLWYGSFFPDAPEIFETAESLAGKWHGAQRIFVWQDLAKQPAPLPSTLTPVYVIERSGGKEIVSNQPAPHAGTPQPTASYPVPAPAPETSHAPAPAPSAAHHRSRHHHNRHRTRQARRAHRAHAR